MKLSSAIERVSPEVAKQMLKTAMFRRRHKTDMIEQWAGLMKSGEWLVNGQPIIFNEFGQLVDGVARLLALVHSGTNQNLFVVRGVLHSNTHTIDRGCKRKYIDRYIERGRPNIRLIYDGVSLYLRYKNQSATRFAIGDFIEKAAFDLQELANFSRKSMIHHRMISDRVIFAYALEHGIEKTCSQLRKTTGNDTISKLRGIHKLTAFEKL